MTFTVRKANHREWPVTIALNVCDAAGAVSRVERSFVAHFAPFSEAEHEAICIEVDKEFPPPAGGRALERAEILVRNAAYFRRLVCGWGEGVEDEAGKPISFSVDVLVSMVTGPDGFAVSDGLFAAIAEIRLGVAPAKNFATSPAPGELPSAGEVETTAIAPT